MPKARYLAPWQQVDLIEALQRLEVEGAELDAEALEGLRGKPAIYHCMSRVVDRQFIFGDEEKEQFVGYMRAYERFCQVRVLAFCVMSNHFHILLEVPTPPPQRGRDWSDEQLLGHLSCLYSPHEMAEIRWRLEHYRAQKNHRGAEELRESFLRRMWDLSQFMKTLKQRFTRWFNTAHERRGTLWEERFKSVLVEDGHAAQVVSAYIDLNPVRACMVESPEDYRWCSYGEAMAGKTRAREGILRVMIESRSSSGSEENACKELRNWPKVASQYREALLAKERSGARDEPGETRSRSEAAAIRGRVRQFVDGLVIGSQAFVDQTFRLTRDRFGPNRQDGGRKIRGLQTELRSMRDLGMPPGD